MSRLSYQEYLLWQAYYHIEPFGDLRQDFRIGQLIASVANMVGGSKDKSFEATDFIPTFDSVEQARIKQSVDEMNEDLAKSFQALKGMAQSSKRVNI